MIDEAHVLVVYEQIVEANHLRALPIKFATRNALCGGILDSNAFNLGDKILVCRGLLNPKADVPAQNDAQLAFVLAHELGHSDPYVRRLPDVVNEFGADQKAKQYLQHTTYNVCYAARWLLGTGNGGWSQDEKGRKVDYHASGRTRYNALGC